MYFSGMEGDKNVLAMDFMGQNLNQLLSAYGGKLSLRTVLYLADQMVF